MNLEEKVMTDLKVAMLAKDEKSLRSLRAIKAAIINTKTAEGFGGEIKEDDEIKLLQKLVKQRKDSLEIYETQNREDLAVKEREEIEIIEKFLPKQMDETELRKEIETIINESGASSPADMGKVMGIANKKLAGKADGKGIAAIVKDILAKKFYTEADIEVTKQLPSAHFIFFQLSPDDNRYCLPDRYAYCHFQRRA